MACKTLEEAWRLADIRSDAGDKEAASAINFCAGTADQYSRWLTKLAWACNEKTAAKRRNTLNIVLAEMRAQDESTAAMPVDYATA